MEGGVRMGTPEKVVVAGSSGLIGSALGAALRADGLRVTRLVRRAPQAADEVEWAPGAAPLDPGVLQGARAVVNLGGASIGRLPWTRTYRSELVASRIAPTRTLADAIRDLGADAPAFLSASAVGFYGDRPGELLTEASAPGSTFLAELCAEWEGAAREAGPAAQVTLLRTASLLHPAGVLKPLIALTKLGVSGPLGSGDQIWPWISLTDEVRAIHHLIDRAGTDTAVTGPVNLSGPTPASARTIGRELAQRLHRPYIVPAPAWALRTVLGRDAADSLLLADASVAPDVLTRSGFAFAHPTAESAIAAALTAPGA